MLGLMFGSEISSHVHRSKHHQGEVLKEKNYLGLLFVAFGDNKAVLKFDGCMAFISKLIMNEA